MATLTWLRSPAGGTAHLFPDGPGWSASLCRAVRFTVRLVRTGALFGDERWLCRDCIAAVGVPVEAAMSEGEAREAFGA
jgi:hypothetical protein